MTNPQGPPSEGPSVWARPGDEGPLAQPPKPGEASTERLRPNEPATGGTDESQPLTGDSAPQNEPSPATHTEAQRAGHRRPPGPSTGKTTQLAAPEEDSAPVQAKRRFLRDPLTLFLVMIIVVSLALAGLIGGELYARHVANSKVAQAVACVVRDQATASFGVAPLLLWQVATRHFTNISVETAGNQIRGAKGMKVQIAIQNVQLKSSPSSKGTIGALDASITWSAEGIRESVQNAIPVLGAFVTSSVVTHPTDGTIELKGMLNDIVAKPVVTGNGVALQIVTFNTLGFSLPKETVQSTLDEFTSALTRNYPLGIHADSVQVTSTGVVSHFSTHNAAIPTGVQDPCFAQI
ncbi:LmeA family phospholipid-binding protein [Mycobacterium sp.]|uniref:LmeA family phospholipid-binding protein n=1 Tax=Mycobacterium sp. TaxID=1785 RepID=UPI003BAAE7B2